MKKLKILSLILVGALTISTLTGCGKKEELSTQDLFYQDLSNVVKYSAFEFDVEIEQNILKENIPGNTLASSLVDINETITKTSFIKGGVDYNTPAFNMVMGENVDIGTINYISLVLNPKAAYINLAGLFKNYRYFSNSSYMGKVSNSSEEEDSFTNEETISMIVEMFGAIIPNDYIMINYDDLNEQDELISAFPIGADDEEDKDIDTENLKEQLLILPTYINFAKELSYAIFKAAESSYEESLIQYDETNRYYYIVMNPSLYKDFSSRMISILESNLNTSISSMYEAYFEKELVLDEEKLAKFNETIGKQKEKINEVKDSDFEKIVYAFFPGQGVSRFVVEKTINQYESTTTTITITNNPEYTVNSPSNAKSIEEIVNGIIESIFGGFDIEDEEDNSSNIDFDYEYEDNYNLVTKIVAPISYLPKDIYSRQIQINNEMYRFPINYNSFFESYEEEVLDTYYKEETPVLVKSRMYLKGENNLENTFSFEFGDELEDDKIVDTGYEIEDVLALDENLYGEEKDDSSSLISSSNFNDTSTYVEILYELYSGDVKAIYFDDAFMIGEDLIKLVLPQGIQIGRTYDDLINCYGRPTSFEMNNDFITYTYSSTDYAVTFKVENDFITSISLFDTSKLVDENTIEEYITKYKVRN